MPIRISHGCKVNSRLSYHDFIQGGILMSTSPININKPLQTNVPSNQELIKPNQEVAQKEAETTKTFDTIELGKNSKTEFGTYKVDRQKLNQIKLDFQKNVDSFREMVRALIEKQGKSVAEVLKNPESTVIKVDDETKLAAQEAISEEGYWGVSQTATRILDFAKTISGGDPSKIDALKEAFKEGFEAAKKAFGGELPEISQLTYDRVMEGFDSWENEQ